MRAGRSRKRRGISSGKESRTTHLVLLVLFAALFLLHAVLTVAARCSANAPQLLPALAEAATQKNERGPRLLSLLVLLTLSNSSRSRFWDSLSALHARRAPPSLEVWGAGLPQARCRLPRGQVLVYRLEIWGAGVPQAHAVGYHAGRWAR